MDVRYAAVFVLPDPLAGTSPEVLAPRVGVTLEGRQLMWAGAPVEVDSVQYPHVPNLRVSLSFAAFLSLVEQSPEQRPAEALARAFAAACVELGSDFAFIHHGSPVQLVEDCKDAASWFLGLDVERLVQHRMSLLFLSRNLAPDLAVPTGREAWTTPEGSFLYSSSGAKRWW